MTSIPGNPISAPEAVVCGKHWRFTVLTPALIRMEYSAEGKFEDRATQVVIHRDFPVPPFEAVQQDGKLRILTDAVELTYTGGPFTADSLQASFRSEAGYVWRFGQPGDVLPGTCRTLDDVDGPCPLDPSIMSRRQMAVLDDSRTPVFSRKGWFKPHKPGTDVYLFAYRTAYAQALQDFCRLTGQTPLLPRFTLGNWWSRYYRYTQEEYLALMARFREEGIPLSVAVIDMDWHLVDIDRRFGTGWTGFTWNRELFPDHPALLKALHDQGLEVTLNLHPAEGVGAHEACYDRVARRMGVDPATEQSIPFDCTDPDFLRAYFEEILHPMEVEGVDFWWIDWQQGTTSKMPGFDPLWVLNHLHAADSARDGKRPLTFSRYAGSGSHRYPIGFSGDTHVTWDSLRFQPYFTACASNIAYSWWSHDIGGHMRGVRDDELTARWVQLGVFSPIMRLHSTNSPFQSKEPWTYDGAARESMTAFLRLRHRLIPYLYTMNRRTHDSCLPLVSPMYYAWPEDDRAYRFNPNQYLFGTELLVSPITDPADPVTLRGCARTWLPEGMWFDLFTGMAYRGGRCISAYRTLREAPVFARAGALLPLSDDPDAHLRNPGRMTLEVFPGADGAFRLYEDDGRSMTYEDGQHAWTDIRWSWGDTAMLTIGAPEGDPSVLPQERSWNVVFRCTQADQVTLLIDGEETDAAVLRTGDGLSVACAGYDQITIRLTGAAIRPNDVSTAVHDLLLHAQCSNDLKHALWDAFRSTDAAGFVCSLGTIHALPDALRQALTELVLADR